MLTKFLNFNQTSKCWPNFGISTRFGNFYQIYEFWPNFCPCTHFKIIFNTFMIRKWGYCWDLLFSKGTTTLFGPCCDVKCRSTSAAKKWKYAMANFTLTDQKSIINLTQFETIIWAKHNTQFNKWKIMTFVWRVQM